MIPQYDFKGHSLFKFTEINKELEIERCDLQIEDCSWYHAVSYILFKKEGTLMVKGDFGQAIYQLNSNNINWKQLYNPDYKKFANNCVASEYGRQFIEFNFQNIMEYIIEILKSLEKGDFDDDTEFNSMTNDQLIMKIIKTLNIKGINSDQEWHTWCENNGKLIHLITNSNTLKLILDGMDNVKQIDDYDWYEIYNWFDKGRGIASYCRIHLDGLMECIRRLYPNEYKR